MIQVKSPRCKGSLKTCAHTKRARCPWCGNLVRVDGNQLCEHWWSRRAHRYSSTAYKRGNR